MGSDSDLPVVREGYFDALERLWRAAARCTCIPRTARPWRRKRVCPENARKNGFGAIIAAAGKAALTLAGALAANTTLPVIGIPVKSSTLDGAGRASLHRTDAVRDSRRHGRHRRGGERGASRASDLVASATPRLAGEAGCGAEALPLPKRCWQKTRR